MKLLTDFKCWLTGRQVLFENGTKILFGEGFQYGMEASQFNEEHDNILTDVYREIVRTMGLDRRHCLRIDEVRVYDKIFSTEKSWWRYEDKVRATSFRLKDGCRGRVLLLTKSSLKDHLCLFEEVAHCLSVPLTVDRFNCKSPAAFIASVKRKSKRATSNDWSELRCHHQIYHAFTNSFFMPRLPTYFQNIAKELTDQYRKTCRSTANSSCGC